MTPKSPYLLAAAALLLSACITQSAPPSPANLTIYFIDVGQGDSTLVIASNATHTTTLLIDAGDSSHAKNTTRLVAETAPLGLDHALATHPDADHIAGFQTVLGQVRVAEFDSNGDDKDTQTYARIAEKLDALAIPKKTLKQGDEIPLAGDARAQVIWPRDGFEGDYNARSVVLRVTLDSFCVLLTGDADKKSEEGMLADNAVAPCKVLKAGHHGSKYSSSQPFLAVVSPELVAISAGEDNRYGHPNPEALARFAAVNAKTIHTAEVGTIVVTTNGTGYYVNGRYTG